MQISRVKRAAGKLFGYSRIVGQQEVQNYRHITAAMFLCEAGHLFVTFDEAQLESDTDSRPYEKHRLN